MKSKMQHWLKTLIIAGCGVVISTMITTRALALDDEIEVLRARAYVALADVLYQQAQGFADQLVEMIKKRGVQPPAAQDQIGFSYTDDEKLLFELYKAVEADAISNYEKLFAADYGVPEAVPFSLPYNYSFLKREAYNKWFLLREGYLFGANRRRAANLYAVNADFRKDIIEKTQVIVSELARLDNDGRRLRKEYGDFSVSRVGTAGELIGVSETKLQAQNYGLDVQTQILQYDGQVRSLDVQQEQEAEEIGAKAAILKPAREMFRRSWSNLMNIKATSPSAPDVIEISASAEIPVFAGSFAPGTHLFLKASGRWLARGVANTGVIRGLNRFSFLNQISTLMQDLNGAGQIFDPNLDGMEMPRLPDLDPVVLGQMERGTLDCDANGVFVSDSESVSAGISYSRGESSGTSGGVGFLGVSVGVSESSSTGTSGSRGRSKSQGTTIGLKSDNTNMPSANIGALIAYLDGPGLTSEQKGPVLIGLQNVLRIPETATGDVTISFIQNDAIGYHGRNIGHLSLEITKNTEFAGYLTKFLKWFDKDCDAEYPGGPKTVNCGFAAIVDQLAFQRDPQSFARSALRAFEQTYPVDQQPVPPLFDGYLSDITAASTNLAIAQRDLTLALQRHEMTAIAAMTAKDALELSQQKAKETQELVETIQRRTDVTNQKASLLIAGTRYFEDEVANNERLRAQVLARLKRYMGIVIDTYNYLYLDNFKIMGEPQPGYEGEFYRSVLDLLVDQISNSDVNDDLTSPNRGFVIHQLQDAQMQELLGTNKTAFTISPEQFLCEGFGIEDQARVHIEKVGYLLDIDPINEQLFFKNPNVRRMAIRTTHGNSNIHFDLNGNVIEYYLPSQTKDIYGYSQRVLTDYHSDYVELGLSSLFQRMSFRNTSYATDWTVELLA